MFTHPLQRRVSIGSFDKSLTEQSHKDSCDIRLIMRKAEKTGVIAHNAKYAGQYGDFVSIPDYHGAQNIVAEAKSMFDTVPARIRAKFDNDPAKFLSYMTNPKHRDAIIELGLDVSHLPIPAAPPAAPAAPAVPAATPVAPAT